MHAAAAGGLDICPAVNRVDRIDRAIHQVKNQPMRGVDPA
jgi:hypothetical protein